MRSEPKSGPRYQRNSIDSLQYVHLGFYEHPSMSLSRDSDWQLIPGVCGKTFPDITSTAQTSIAT